MNSEANSPLWWGVEQLRHAYREGTLSPVEVAREALARVDAHDPTLHAFVTVTADELLRSAAEAANAYRRGDDAPLLGVPVAVKDVFHLAGAETTLGSAVFAGQVSAEDSGAVARLRRAGAAFVGKTSTAEFGQSATTENRLLPDTANPWDPTRTPGGSSGGSAAAVAAGLTTLGLGSDGGGSLRIPGAFTGLVGFKPSIGSCRDERGFRAMSDFQVPGPLARTVDDARIMLEVLCDRPLPRGSAPRTRTVAWCRQAEGHPVHPGVTERLKDVANTLATTGAEVIETDLPMEGWADIFGPLVLAEEHRERGHLLDLAPDRLTDYERATLKAGRNLDPGTVTRARHALAGYRSRIISLFSSYSALLLPTVATPAFPHRQRPREIDGQRVGSLWGAFPFTVAFNVAGTPALTLPAGLVDNLPVGAQLVGPPGGESSLLDLAEDLEEALALPVATALRRLWPTP